MYQHTSILAKPTTDDKISSRTLGYVKETAREELYQLVLDSCHKSGVTKSTLARRLGKDLGQISRLLGAPGNWTIDTFAELLFAADGRVLVATSVCTEEEALANQRHATCFNQSGDEMKITVAAQPAATAHKVSRKNTAELSW